MENLPEKIKEASGFIKKQCGLVPDAGIILGTGLGALAGEIEKEKEISYADIPNFPVSTVESHSGRLIFGELSGKKVVAMQGRFHFYEGYTMQQVAFPVRVMKALGAENLIVSNACGGLNFKYSAGDLMLIIDHINLLGGNPLIGKNFDELGIRFPDMSEPYSREFIKYAGEAAMENGINLHKGVYAAMAGPMLETAAEYRMLRTIGADAIGMSTIPEVIAAVHSSMKVLGISVITDICFPDTLKPASLEEIIKVASGAEPNLVKIIKSVLKKMK
ncbi:MAG: purine-nucleoside phosphorylase [Fibrobacterota bacterium]